MYFLTGTVWLWEDQAGIWQFLNRFQKGIRPEIIAIKNSVFGELWLFPSGFG